MIRSDRSGQPQKQQLLTAAYGFLIFLTYPIGSVFLPLRMITSYTSQEQATIAQAPLLAGFAVAASDLGIVSTAIEIAALSREIVGAARKYPQNSVIQSVFSEAALRNGTVKLDPPTLKPEDVKAGALINQAIAAINTALDSLHGKATPEEIGEYKTFIYTCAEAVANAAGSGLFGSGEKVSEQEAVALTKIKEALTL
ncbi:MAG: hypothetical protein ACAF41_02810 [Leptolyngbya sp. BL-A-14]